MPPWRGRRASVTPATTSRHRDAGRSAVHPATARSTPDRDRPRRRRTAGSASRGDVGASPRNRTCSPRPDPAARRHQHVEQLGVRHARGGEHLRRLRPSVKPGMVFTSLSTRPSAVRKKSIRATPAQPSASKIGSGCPSVLAVRRRRAAPGSGSRRSVVLGGVVEEPVDDDLERRRHDPLPSGQPSTAMSISRPLTTSSTSTRASSASAASSAAASSAGSRTRLDAVARARGDRLDHHRVGPGVRRCGRRGQQTPGAVATPIACATSFVTHLSIATAPAADTGSDVGHAGEVAAGRPVCRPRRAARAPPAARRRSRAARRPRAASPSGRSSRSRHHAVAGRWSAPPPRTGPDRAPRDGGGGGQRDVVLAVPAATDHRDPDRVV